MNLSHRIEFQKPNLAELTKVYTVVDLHFHTHYSDGLNSIGATVERVRKLGIGIAITDHNEITGAVEIDRCKDILSIPGIEITSKEGSHLLVYFYSTGSLKKFYARSIKPFMGQGVMSSLSLGMEEIIRRARAYKTVIIFAHPYCAAYTGVFNSMFSVERIDELCAAVDGVEVINAENLSRWNLQCALLGFNLNKAITGGSDGHTLYEMGRAISYAECPPTREAFLDAIREKRNRVLGKEIAMLRKFTSNGYKLKTNLKFKNYPGLVEKNLKYSYRVINLKSKTLRDNVRQHLNGKLKKSPGEHYR